MNGLLGFFRKVECFSLTHAGCVRRENQDSFCVNAAKTVFCVADGMGGGAAGLLASQIVVSAVAAAAAEESVDFMKRIEDVDYAILVANDRIREEIRAKGHDMMGSTVATLVLDTHAKSDRLAIGHVGDSRVYRRRGVVFERMTDDHRKSEYSHLLTRAVGANDSMEVDWCWAGVQRNDIWLVCTDGVHDMLPDSTISALVGRGGTVKDIGARIADAVLRAGARDNFTLIVVKT